MDNIMLHYTDGTIKPSVNRGEQLTINFYKENNRLCNIAGLPQVKKIDFKPGQRPIHVYLFIDYGKGYME